MKQVIAWFKKWESLIKLILFMSISGLVIIELVRLFKTVSFEQILSATSGLSSWRLVILIVLGFVTVLPMVAYDVILTRELKKPQKWSYLLGTSWTINSLNNLVGFAGLVDVGLRYSFYSDEERSEASLQGISRVIPYFMAGLSCFALLSLGLTLTGTVSGSISQYWLLLLGAAAYLPVLLLISGRQNWTYFGQLQPKTIGQLVLASGLDWASVIAFFIFVGYSMGFVLPIVDLIPLFLIAIIIGILSMIPGSLGSFDLVMVTGLVGLGLDRAQALSWLLLFRLFYYIGPFLLGVFLFVKQMGGRINDKYLGLPHKALATVVSGLVVWGLRLFGFYLILSAIVPQELKHIPLLKTLSAFQGQFIWQFPSVLLGVLFFLEARFVRRQLKASLVVGLGLGLVTLIYLNLVSLSLPSSLFVVILLALIWANRRDLTRQSYIYSWEDSIKDFLYIGGTLFVTLGLLGHLESHHLSHLSHLSHLLTHWYYLLVSAIVIVFTYHLLLRYANQRTSTFGESFEKDRYQAFLTETTQVPLDAALAYLGDKLLYWYQEGGHDRAVFQFAMDNNKVLVMSDPIAQEGYLEPALQAFLSEAEASNLLPVFYEVNQETTLLLHAYGFDFMKFGETARVALQDFTTEGKHGKKFRTVVNKLENKGYSFEVVLPPFTDDLLDRLEDISTSWLDGRQEKGFSLGYFERDYLQLAPLGLVRDADGEIQAFVNFLPSNHDQEASIDLMRYQLDTAPNGVMDYLFVKLLLHFKEEGVAYFDLGMAPLSNVGQAKHSFLQEKVAYLIYAFTNRFYSFSGLRQYKDKFGPVWSPRYVVYPDKSWLVLNMIAIYRVDNRTITKDQLM